MKFCAQGAFLALSFFFIQVNSLKTNSFLHSHTLSSQTKTRLYLVPTHRSCPYSDKSSKNKQKQKQRSDMFVSKFKRGSNNVNLDEDVPESYNLRNEQVRERASDLMRRIDMSMFLCYVRAMVC